MELSSLETLQKAGNALRSIGLTPLVGIGRALLRRTFRDVSMRVDGFSMTGTFGQRAFLHDLAAKVHFDAFQVKLFNQLVRPGSTVLDIGAHIGWYTLQAARAVGPGGKVYAFEADPRNYSILLRNVQRNGFGERVCLVPKAVWDRSEKGCFFLDRDFDSVRSSSSLVATPQEIYEKITIECVAVDDFLEPSVAVDVVKLDIEGAERKALKGMRRTLSCTGHHVSVFVECNPRALRAADSNVGDLLRQLKELGFIVMTIDERNNCLCPPMPSSIEHSLYTNLLCVRDEGMLKGVG